MATTKKKTPASKKPAATKKKKAAAAKKKTAAATKKKSVAKKAVKAVKKKAATKKAAVKKKSVVKVKGTAKKAAPTKPNKIVPKQTRIMETILRDAHQCILATRMRTEDMIPALEMLDNAGYWSLEAWGGATFDAALRFAKEDPWERLKIIKSHVKKTPLQMLLRGQNLVGYRHYSDDVVRKFVDRAAVNGVGVFRIFDALNDIRNLETAIKAVKETGQICEPAISYTTSPVHSHDDFVKMAIEFEQMGADVICVKDMAGLMRPEAAFDLFSKLKSKVSVPLHLHGHESAGLASMSYFKAIEGGCDIVDTAISSIGGGTAQPPTECIVAALEGTPYDTGLDMDKLTEISDFFKNVRKKYSRFESEYSNINPKTLAVQIPGGMISNLANQLKEQDALDRMDEVLDEIPNVRKDMGYPPLVTPTSQIVGTQATLNVLTGERYKVITSETKNYFKGLYGKTPGDVDPKAKRKAVGKEEVITCRPADLLEPEMETLTREIGAQAKTIEDVLSYALFPQVAKEFFEEREAGTLTPEPLEEIGGAAPSATHAVNLAPSEFNVTVHGEEYNVKVAGVGHAEEGIKPVFLKINNRLEEVLIESLTEVIPSSAGEIQGESSTHSKRRKAQSDHDVTSAVPGKIITVKVKAGDVVKAGDTMCTVEAMKMENEVHATISGVVKEVFVKVGDAINPDETLMEIE